MKIHANDNACSVPPCEKFLRRSDRLRRKTQVMAKDIKTGQIDGQDVNRRIEQRYQRYGKRILHEFDHR